MQSSASYYGYLTYYYKFRRVSPEKQSKSMVLCEVYSVGRSLCVNNILELSDFN